MSDDTHSFVKFTQCVDPPKREGSWCCSDNKFACVNDVCKNKATNTFQQCSSANPSESPQNVIFEGCTDSKSATISDSDVHFYCEKDQNHPWTGLTD